MTKKYKPDAPLTDKEWEALGSTMYGINGLPPEAQAAIRNAMRGRPPSESPKKSITIRLDADVVAGYRSHGKGWQTEMNAILRAALENRAQ